MRLQYKICESCKHRWECSKEDRSYISEACPNCSGLWSFDYYEYAEETELDWLYEWEDNLL
jgi:hydrogenase maturation factor HypF (carbamoyltransferase family)